MTGAIYTCFSCMAGVFLLLRQDDRVPCVLLGRVPRKCSLQVCDFANERETEQVAMRIVQEMQVEEEQEVHHLQEV